MKRTLSTILLLGCVLYAPWWFVFVFGAIAAFHFPRYYEIIFLGLLSDLLYGADLGGVSLHGMLGLIAGTIVFVCMERIKYEVRK